MRVPDSAHPRRVQIHILLPDRLLSIPATSLYIRYCSEALIAW